MCTTATVDHPVADQVRKTSLHFIQVGCPPSESESLKMHHPLHSHVLANARVVGQYKLKQEQHL